MLAQTFSALLSMAALGLGGLMLSRWMTVRRDEERRLVRVPVRSRRPPL